MGLTAITAAAAQLAAVSAEHRQTTTPHATSSPSSRTRPRSRSRSSSLLSDSTDPDPDDWESDDASLPSPTIKTRPAPHHPQSPAKKRRAVSPTPTKKTSPLTSVSPSSSMTAVPAEEAVQGNSATPTSQEHADTFPAEMLLDLAGSTSAEVRRMNEDERALVHYKRRLRNRESAKRSRARRQATIHDIQGELEDLRDVTAKLLDRCVSFARVNDTQGRELETLRKEKHLLESMLREGGGAGL